MYRGADHVSKLFFEEQQSRTEALAIVRAFEAAASNCR
jgi:hypothetical protein